MANSIEYASKFLPVIDDIYKEQSMTGCLDTMTKVDFTGANEVKVLKVNTTGLGDYSREDGYPKGDVTAVWETMKLTQERGKEFSVDRADDEETLGTVFGAVTGNFMREHVIPEIDAYRFAQYASCDGIGGKSGVLTKDTVIDEIDTAIEAMDANEVPLEGRVMYVNSDLKRILNSAVTRHWSNDNDVNTVISSYNGMRVIYVPKTRFYTSVTLNDGAAASGFEKAENATGINFMIVEPSAVVQAVKFSLPKIFSPDENQDKDMWKFQFRLYHDAFVYDNKKAGIYVHKSDK